MTLKKTFQATEIYLFLLCLFVITLWYLKNFLETWRSSHQWCFIKEGVHRNFTKFTGKHLRQSLFFNRTPLEDCFSTWYFQEKTPNKATLTLPARCISESCVKINFYLIFYFHTLRCLKRFYEGLKGLRKTFRDTINKCANKNLS